MTTSSSGRIAAERPTAATSAQGCSRDRVQAAEEISWKALELAQHARSAGLTELCHLLESAALSAAAEAEAGRWPQEC